MERPSLSSRTTISFPPLQIHSITTQYHSVDILPSTDAARRARNMVYMLTVVARRGRIKVQRPVRICLSVWVFPSRAQVIHESEGSGDFSITRPLKFMKSPSKVEWMCRTLIFLSQPRG